MASLRADARTRPIISGRLKASSSPWIKRTPPDCPRKYKRFIRSRVLSLPSCPALLIRLSLAFKAFSARLRALATRAASPLGTFTRWTSSSIRPALRGSVADWLSFRVRPTAFQLSFEKRYLKLFKASPMSALANSPASSLPANFCET